MQGGLVVVAELRAKREQLRRVRVQVACAREPLRSFGRELGHVLASRADHLLVDRHREQVGLGEVAVVVRLLLGAHRGDRARDRIEVQRLGRDRTARLQDLRLARDLRADASFQESERVHVLELRLGAQLVGARPAQRDVGVAAQRPLLHVHIAHPQPAQGRAQ